jgi:tetratricopeptide (TPR) repeat protein
MKDLRMPDAATTLQNAMALHRAGKLVEAEQAYAAIPQSAPQHVDAVHLRGVLALQRGNPGQAIELITQAVRIRSDVPAMHANLAEAYRSVGRNTDAIAHCRAALKLDPKYHACRNNLALALAAAGETAEAVNELQRTVEADPRNALAWNNLANVLRGQRRNDDALTAARRAVLIEPANPEFLSNLGQMLLEDGDTEEALQRLQNAVKLAPQLAAARNNLGNVLRELGRLDEAESQYNEALRLRPELAITHNNLGQLEQQRGIIKVALEWYEKSIRMDARAPRTLCNYASALAEIDRREESLAWYKRAHQLDPDMPEALIGIAGYLRLNQQIDDAEKLLHHALKVNPKLTAAHLALAGIAAERGDFTTSEKEARTALRLEPRCGGAYEQLANGLRKKLPEADVEKMKELLAAGPEVREAARLSVLYGLGTWSDQVGQFELSAKCLDEANTLQHKALVQRGLAYNPAVHTEWVSQLLSVFTPAHFERTRGWGNDTDVPVFVLGLPRSGTTLAEQVLASHPSIHGADELRLARESYYALAATMGVDGEPHEAVPKLTEAAVQKVAADHLDKLRVHSSTARHIVDKMPENYLHIGLILTLFPNAKIIHMQRDFRDVATSCWGVHFAQIRWGCDKAAITSHFRNYRRAMEHWNRVLPGRVLHMPYAEMVDDLETHARRMLDWVGVEWNEKCLEFHKTERNVRTASLAQVRQPLYKKAVARWKNYEPWWADWYAELDAAQRGS